MNTRSLDMIFDTRFFQEPIDGAYQQLRKAGMLQLGLNNALSVKFANTAREIMTREGIRLEDALLSVSSFGKVHFAATQKSNIRDRPPKDLTERDVKDMLTFRP